MTFVIKIDPAVLKYALRLLFLSGGVSVLSSLTSCAPIG